MNVNTYAFARSNLERNSEKWDDQMRTYLFSKGEITELEDEEEDEEEENEDLGIQKI
jgi:hypothetical protein